MTSSSPVQGTKLRTYHLKVSRFALGWYAAKDLSIAAMIWDSGLVLNDVGARTRLDSL